MVRVDILAKRKEVVRFYFSFVSLFLVLVAFAGSSCEVFLGYCGCLSAEMRQNRRLQPANRPPQLPA